MTKWFRLWHQLMENRELIEKEVNINKDIMFKKSKLKTKAK
jgi:hypothetical protein